MVTLRGAESAAFTQVMEVTRTWAERRWTGRTREVMPQERRKETGVGRRRKGAGSEALLTSLLAGTQI